MKNRGVLVTGGAGFVGAHLIAALINSNYKNITAILHSADSLSKLKYILDLYNLKTDHPALTLVVGELGDYQFLKDQFQNKHSVFHTAAIVSFAKGREREVISQNVHITECCIEAAMVCNVERFIHVSSIAALHTPPYPEQTTETSVIQTLHSKSAYGISKFLSENVVWKASTRGLNCTVVLPAVILGQGDARQGGSPKLLKLYSKRNIFYTEGITGYVGVTDVVNAMILLSERSESIGERYILCSENLSFGEIFTICSGIKPKYKLPNSILQIAKQTLQFLNNLGIITPLSSSTLDTLQERCFYDGTKITKQLNFNYTKIEKINL